MMRVTRCAAVLAALSAQAGAAVAHAAPPPHRSPPGKPPAVAITKVTCSTAGSPPSAPTGIMITNAGTTLLRTGTRIAWEFAKGAKGVYTLDSDLAAGRGVFKGGVNPAGLEPGSPCTAKIL